ncbi:hypothetical protein DM860_005381 [Cuscuta australis]|uniref:DUF1985 domain-containing protein n=1 Tax=Cuscuta australis TaxID=267555 RepID=A0A328DZ63_9ASTE|nr:hypothetical protein DM860_005381 [Cuscuta australis]
MRLSIACLNPKLAKRPTGDLRNRDTKIGGVPATKTERINRESPIVMSARKTTMPTGVAIDGHSDFVDEQGSEITVKCVSGEGYRRLCREDILASKANVKANCYCNVLSGVEKLRRTLTESELEAFSSTPFGHLLDVGNLKWVNGQLLILLALNYVEPMEPDSDAISFHIRDRVVSFKKTDFALITGFKFGSPSEQEREYTGTSDISKRYFGGRSVVTRDEV